MPESVIGAWEVGTITSCIIFPPKKQSTKYMRQKAFFFRRRFSWPGLCERGCVLYPKKTLWIGAAFTTDSKRASIVRYGGAGRLDIRRPPPAFANLADTHTKDFL